MSPQTHSQTANFIGSICNLLRGPYKRNEYRKVVGYEIPLNRHFYRYEAPRELEVIAKDIKELESDIVSMLAEITGSAGDE